MPALECLYCEASRREVRDRVVKKSTVEIPAPTAASVKATSTASRVVKIQADSRLKMPDSTTTSNRSRSRTMATATTTNSVISAISTRSTCRAISANTLLKRPPQ